MAHELSWFRVDDYVYMEYMRNDGEVIILSYVRGEPSRFKFVSMMDLQEDLLLREELEDSEEND